MKEFIESGKAVMGIEFGSTRIKAVLIDDKYRVVAQARTTGRTSSWTVSGAIRLRRLRRASETPT